MEKINRNIKVKILLLLLLSNSSIYLLSSTNAEEGQSVLAKNTEKLTYRKDYVILKIQANLLTSFASYKAVLITDKRNSFIVPYSILVSFHESKSRPLLDESLQKSRGEAIIYVHKKYALALTKKRHLQIMPLIEGLSPKKNGVQYEINF